MKKLLLIMAAALMMMTQCRKQETMPVTPSAGRPVEMTVTVGPGSKTDIASTGGITWSTGDKLYVGDGSKYIGYLTLAGGVGTQTGTFTGGVGLADVEEGVNLTFHFYYLGSADHTSLSKGAESVEVDFSSQNIIKGTDGKLTNASLQHVCYGRANGTVIGGVVTDINVMLVSKVAIARFSFKRGAADYTCGLKLSGDNICNKMTVNFNSTGFACTGTKGDISLTDTTSSEKYVMLVPTDATTTSQALTFTGSVSGEATLKNGIKPNQFYGLDAALAVPLEGAFSVAVGTTVEFSKGNLQYLGKSDGTGTWRFAEHQWDYMGAGPNASADTKGNVDLSSLGYTDGMYNTGSGAAGGSETDADKAAARDLFGWGATGCKDTRSNASTYQTNYQPYSTSNTAVASGTQAYDINRYGYGPDYYNASEYGLSVEAKSDWGAVPGLPPAGEGMTWRTLSRDEWDYLINKRTVNGGTGDGKSYKRATVNGVYGMILYPDSYTAQSSSTSYSGDTWTSMEEAGVVFLPAAGYRNGTDVRYVGSDGYYWSGSCVSRGTATSMYFWSGTISCLYHMERYRGYSVRLVR